MVAVRDSYRKRYGRDLAFDVERRSRGETQTLLASLVVSQLPDGLFIPSQQPQQQTRGGRVRSRTTSRHSSDAGATRLRARYGDGIVGIAGYEHGAAPTNGARTKSWLLALPDTRTARDGATHGASSRPVISRESSLKSVRHREYRKLDQIQRSNSRLTVFHNIFLQFL